jgi:hypothetical protein
MLTSKKLGRMCNSLQNFAAVTSGGVYKIFVFIYRDHSVFRCNLHLYQGQHSLCGHQHLLRPITQTVTVVSPEISAQFRATSSSLTCVKVVPFKFLFQLAVLTNGD